MSPIEDRLTTLESEVAALKRQLQADRTPRIRTGSMKDRPEFEEVLRLGRELLGRGRPDADPS